MRPLNYISHIHPLPGIMLWKKSKNHVFLDVNKEFAHHFGFKDEASLIGKSDYDLPIATSHTIEHFLAADKIVLESGLAHRFLEIYQIKYYTPKIKLTVKSTFMTDNNTITGTLGYCIDLPLTILQFCNPGLNQTSGVYSISGFDHKLSPRENECLFFTLQGKTAKEIAIILNLSRRTVEEYISSIKQKLNCTTKRDLILYCQEKEFMHIFPESLLNRPLCLSM